MAEGSNDQELAAGAAVRRLVRDATTAALATTLAGENFPFASLVASAADPCGRPLLLLSGLAEHTRNLAADPRAALLFCAPAGAGELLAAARATLLGTIAPEAADEAAALAARFLARHPEAAEYAGLPDFRMFRMTVERAHLVAGFGRIRRVGASAVVLDAEAVAPLAAAEAALVAHLNADHCEAVALIAARLPGLGEADWRVAGIDPDGLDLRAGTVRARIAFAAPVGTPDEARRALAALARAARATREP